MPQVLVIEKKTGCRRPVQRIIAIDDSSSQKPQAAAHTLPPGSWTGQVQSGGGVYYGRRKKK